MLLIFSIPSLCRLPVGALGQTMNCYKISEISVPAFDLYRSHPCWQCLFICSLSSLCDEIRFITTCGLCSPNCVTIFRTKLYFLWVRYSQKLPHYPPLSLRACIRWIFVCIRVQSDALVSQLVPALAGDSWQTPE